MSDISTDILEPTETTENGMGNKKADPKWRVSGSTNSSQDGRKRLTFGVEYTLLQKLQPPRRKRTAGGGVKVGGGWVFADVVVRAADVVGFLAVVVFSALCTQERAAREDEFQHLKY